MNKKILWGLYNNNILFFLISSIFFINTSCFIGRNIINTVINISCYFISVFIILLFIIDFKFNKFNLSLIVFFIFLFISTVLSESGDVNLFIKIYIPILAYILYLEKAVNHNIKKTIKNLSNLLFIIVSINFLTIVFFKEGLYVDNLYSRNWFLKYDNMHSFIYFPAIAISYLDVIINNRKKRKLNFLILIIAFGVYYCFSANTIVAFSIFLIFYFFKNLLEKNQLINAKNFYIVHLTLFISIVIFRVQKAFDWLISGVFRKNSTFKDRTYIWEKVGELIKQKPIKGYGVEGNDFFSKKMGSIYYTHAHNTYLDVMYKGGIFALASFVYLTLIVTKKLYQYRNNEIARFISVMFFGILLLSTFEAREDKIGLYIMFLLGYYINLFIEEKTIEKEEPEKSIVKNRTQKQDII